MTPLPIRLAVLRHGPTEWNAARRLQGRTDIPLSPAGRTAGAAWGLPEIEGIDWHAWRSYTSPLARCRETADVMLRGMGLPRASVDDRLIERGFGAWEGETLAGLRARYGADMAEWEAKGWDFVEEMLQQGRSIVAVTHRSVIRALYGSASGWDMLGRPPQKLADGCVHLFRLSAAGLSIDELNLPLAR